MRKVLTLGLAATTAISAVAFSTAASAQSYGDSYRRDNDNNTAAVAVIAGVVGLAIGAAIASSNKNRSNSYYGNQYGYGSSPYYGSNAYGYGQTSPYYGSGSGYGYGQSPYYGSGSSYGYGSSPYGGGYGYQRCTTSRQWDPYSRRYVNRQICR